MSEIRHAHQLPEDNTQPRCIGCDIEIPAGERVCIICVDNPVPFSCSKCNMPVIIHQDGSVVHQEYADAAACALFNGRIG